MYKQPPDWRGPRLWKGRPPRWGWAHACPSLEWTDRRLLQSSWQPLCQSLSLDSVPAPPLRSEKKVRHLWSFLLANGDRRRGTILHRRTSNLPPLAVIDDGSAAGDPADCAVLELQLQLPMMHCQHNPWTVEVTAGEKDHPLRIVGTEVKFCWKAGKEKAENS